MGEIRRNGNQNYSPIVVYELHQRIPSILVTPNLSISVPLKERSQRMREIRDFYREM